MEYEIKYRIKKKNGTIAKGKSRVKGVNSAKAAVDAVKKNCMETGKLRGGDVFSYEPNGVKIISDDSRAIDSMMRAMGIKF